VSTFSPERTSKTIPVPVGPVLVPFAVVLEVAEGSGVEGLVVDEQPVDVPRIALAGRDPAVDYLAGRREPEDRVPARRGDHPARAVPDDVVRVHDVVEATVALNPARVVDQELTAVELGRRSQQPGESAVGNR
jgi:hypothetical protein